jgi:hypothetical protein
LLRFQTKELSVRIIQKNKISDEQQDSIQQLENGFRSGGMEYQILINKSMIWQKPNITQVAIY